MPVKLDASAAPYECVHQPEFQWSNPTFCCDEGLHNAAGLHDVCRGCQSVIGHLCHMEWQSSVAIRKCVSVTVCLLWEHTLPEPPPVCWYVCVWKATMQSMHSSATFEPHNTINLHLIMCSCNLFTIWTENHETCMLKSKLHVLHKPSMSRHSPNTRCLCFRQQSCDESSGRLYMN